MVTDEEDDHVIHGVDESTGKSKGSSITLTQAPKLESPKSGARADLSLQVTLYIHAYNNTYIHT